MKSYNNFVGIDIGKDSFVVAVHGIKKSMSYENTHRGIKLFFKDLKKELADSLCILEPTGGYEMNVLLALCDKGVAVHKAHTRKVKDFIRSYGNGAKTDKLDALNLALYGFERGESLNRFTAPSTQASMLYALVQRRLDLKGMLVAEKNRLQSPQMSYVKNSVQSLINVLTAEIEAITAEIDQLIEKDLDLKEKKSKLKTIPGIGNIIANELLVLLPELGRLSRREIASLVGVAPISKDSGKLRGYRRTGHGRNGVKPLLFLAAMAARNSKSNLKMFYEGLIARGKCKMVALTALMRKIIIIANARLKSIPAT